MDVVVVNANGQVTLPARERKKYGYLPGTQLTVVPEKSGLRLEKARVVKESIFDELKRLADAKGITHEDIIRISRRVGKEVHAEEMGAKS